MNRLFKEMVIVGLAAVAGIYLINPTFGLFELLPDNLPLIGNLDEAGAVLILVNTAAYYGLDLSRLYGRKSAENTPPGQ